MTNPIEQGGDVFPLSGLIPEVNLGSPEATSSGYDIEARFGQVWPDGQVADDLIFSVANEPSRANEKFQVILPTTLAWVTFYARARIAVKHPVTLTDVNRHTEDTSDTNTMEILYGNRTQIVPRLFMVERNLEHPTFLTMEEIQAEGDIRTDMKQWLIPAIRRSRYSSPDLTQFRTMLSAEERKQTAPLPR